MAESTWGRRGQYYTQVKPPTRGHRSEEGLIIKCCSIVVVFIIISPPPSSSIWRVYAVYTWTQAIELLLVIGLPPQSLLSPLLRIPATTCPRWGKGGEERNKVIRRTMAGWRGRVRKKQKGDLKVGTYSFRRETTRQHV